MKAKQPKLSIILAVYNEERMIEPCLKLLGFADEIVVVVDSRSTDRSAQIAKRYTKKVYRRTLESFAAQRNYAIGKASGEWVMTVDADERITPALAKEIKLALAEPGDRVGFRIGFLNFFFGRPMHYGGWQERHIRLIKRSQAKYSGDIHETFSPHGPIGRLKEPIWHFSHRNIQSMVRKTLNYGDVQTEEMLKNAHPLVTKRSILSVPTKMIWYRLVRRRGYKDGIVGVIESIYQGFSYFLIYAMLWQRQQKPTLESKYEKLERKARRSR